MRNAIIVLAGVLCLLLSGCTSEVHLIRPLPDETLDLPAKNSPEFEWVIPGFEEEAVYDLVIATDKNFRDVVFSEANIKATRHLPRKEDIFLPGDADYYWKVTGYRPDRYGNRDEEFLCEQVRSFHIKERPKVRVLFKIPPPGREGKIVVTIKGDQYDKDFVRDLEVGEWIDLTAALMKGDSVKKIGGMIEVLMANGTTKYGNIIVDSLTHARMEEILKGVVGDFQYELGGDWIVHMTLGSRTK